MQSVFWTVECDTVVGSTGHTSKQVHIKAVQLAIFNGILYVPYTFKVYCVKTWSFLTSSATYVLHMYVLYAQKVDQ